MQFTAQRVRVRGDEEIFRFGVRSSDPVKRSLERETTLLGGQHQVIHPCSANASPKDKQDLPLSLKLHIRELLGL